MPVCKGLKKEALKTNLIDQQLQFTSESWLGHAIVIVYILVPNRDGGNTLSYFSKKCERAWLVISIIWLKL